MPIRIPAAWRLVLKEIQLQGFPEAAIVGGALRDLVHGVPVKDVDIFVTDSPKLREALGVVFPQGYKTVLHPNSCDYIDSLADVTSVYEGVRHGVEFQIIAVRDQASVEDFVARIDFGICRIGYDGSAAYHPESFIRDVQNKTFTLLRSDDAAQFNRSLERYDRLQAKYPKHTLVVQPEFEHLLPATIDLVPLSA